MERLCKQLGHAIKTHSQYHLFVIRSTVYPGTVDEMVKPIMEENSGKRVGDDFDVCFQPEFLREGSSIKDYDNPPFTVVGTESPKAADMLQGVFGHLPCDFVTTSVRSAEMLKYTCNIFHAVKITFANEIGRLSQSMGVDSHAVMELVCQDKRLNISPAYMKPGFAFGGSCLPKDLKAMLHVAMRSDVATPMLSGILPSNQIHIDRAIDMVLSTGRRAVGLVGLSFKSGTDDLRESPLVLMAERFIGKGLDLQIYDPEVQLSRLIGANKRYIEETIPHIALLMSESCGEVVDRAEVVVVGLRDIAIMETLYARTRSEQLILDLVNIPRCEKLKGEYLGICW